MPREPRIAGLVDAPPSALISLLEKLQHCRLVTDEELGEFAASLASCDAMKDLARSLLKALSECSNQPA